MGGFLTRLIVTYAYICFSNLSTEGDPPASPMLECSPTTDPADAGYIHSFGTTLDARLLSMLCRSTSELLRTL